MMTATLDRLRHLRLGAMADAYLAHQQDTALSALSFDERFSMLVDAEHLYRDNRALARRLKEAKLRMPQACLEDLDHTSATGPGPRAGPATRDVSLDRRASERPDHRRHGCRENVPRLRARPTGVSAGLPRDLSSPAAAL